MSVCGGDTSVKSQSPGRGSGYVRIHYLCDVIPASFFFLHLFSFFVHVLSQLARNCAKIFTLAVTRLSWFVACSSNCSENTCYFCFSVVSNYSLISQ